jgi:hypothetical protein
MVAFRGWNVEAAVEWQRANAVGGFVEGREVINQFAEGFGVVVRELPTSASDLEAVQGRRNVGIEAWSSGSSIKPPF